MSIPKSRVGKNSDSPISSLTFMERNIPSSCSIPMSQTLTNSPIFGMQMEYLTSMITITYKPEISFKCIMSCTTNSHIFHDSSPINLNLSISSPHPHFASSTNLIFLLSIPTIHPLENGKLICLRSMKYCIYSKVILGRMHHFSYLNYPPPFQTLIHKYRYL